MQPITDDVSTPPASPAQAEGLAQAAEALGGTMGWLRRAIRPAQWNAVALSTLDAVDRTGPHRVSWLVAQERITQPGMTGIVDRLAAAGLVQRQPDPADGRAALVAITPAGHDYLVSIRRQRAQVLAAHIGELEPSQQRALAAAAGALAALAARPVTGPQPGSEQEG
jgi:DNA-binding MarR family transcriptional regulator